MASATRPSADSRSPSVAAPGWKQKRADAERGRSLQLLPKPGGRPSPLLLVGRGGVEHVRRVHQHVGRLDARRAERLAESLHPLGADGGLVAVVLGDGGEDLQRLHPRPARREARPCGSRRCPPCGRRGCGSRGGEQRCGCRPRRAPAPAAARRGAVLNSRTAPNRSDQPAIPWIEAGHEVRENAPDRPAEPDAASRYRRGTRRRRAAARSPRSGVRERRSPGAHRARTSSEVTQSRVTASEPSAAIASIGPSLKPELRGEPRERSRLAGDEGPQGSSPRRPRPRWGASSWSAAPPPLAGAGARSGRPSIGAAWPRRTRPREARPLLRRRWTRHRHRPPRGCRGRSPVRPGILAPPDCG